MRQGFFKVHRKIEDSELFQDRDDWLVKLFIWCLCKANWEAKHGLERGQFSITRVLASEQLKVSESRWYRGMKTLERMETISLKSNNQKTIVTVCKYGVYQDVDSKPEQRMNNGRTTDEQPSLDKELKNRRSGADCPQVFDPLNPPYPPELDTPGFRQTWTDLIVDRRSRRLSLRETWCTKMLEKLAGYGVDIATKAIEESILQGWIGIFPDKIQANTTNNSKIGLTEAVMEMALWAAQRDEQDEPQ